MQVVPADVLARQLATIRQRRCMVVHLGKKFGVPKERQIGTLVGSSL